VLPKNPAATTQQRPPKISAIAAVLRRYPPPTHPNEERAAQAIVHHRLFGTPLPGAMVRYRLTHRLGSGGLGVVYAATDGWTGSPVALKTLRPGVPTRWSSCLNIEARALSRVVHPNVVGLRGPAANGLRGPVPFLALEYLEGETMCTWLQTRSRGVQEILAIARAVGRGLAEVHSVGVVHCDLKPKNVMVVPRRDAVIVDFGSSRLVGMPVGRTEQELIRWGTPRYASPEVRRGELGSEHADQWAFARMFWEALTGFEPKGRGLPAHRWRGGRDAVPASVIRTLRRALDPDPNRRWPSVSALLHALTANATPSA